MLTTENFIKMIDDFDKIRKIDYSKKYEEARKKLCKKYNCKDYELFNAINTIWHTKFNMKYYN